MANVAPAYVQVHPSYFMPEIILPYNQASGAFNLLPTGEPMQRLGEGDLAVYAKRLDVRTIAASGQAAYNLLPSISTTLSQIGTPTYQLRVRGEYDHHDSAAMGRWGISIVEAQRLGMRQAHFQLLRLMLLYGMNPQLGEGIINTPGATAISLPPDPFGNTTVSTYDNGAMAQFLLQNIQQVKSRTMQLGTGRKIEFLGPQRVLGLWEYNIVQLTQYQRPGSGTASTAGTATNVAMDNGDEVGWNYDDTLIGKGANGTDAVIMVMPELEKPSTEGINTNIFASLAPGLDANLAMLCDMAAPREIPTPLPGGAIDVLSEMRSTSGWVIRPEAVTVFSMPF